MATVKGIWTFKDVLTSAVIWEEVNFSADGVSYHRIFIDSGGVAPFLTLNYGYNEGEMTCAQDVYAFEEYDGGLIQIGWYSDAGKTIDFGETEQTVSDEFYSWLVENATYAGNILINITENGTTTLATAGKYCDRNIDVNVEVSSGIVNDADKILDGSFSGAYESDAVTKLKRYAFADCKDLTSVSLPNCTELLGGYQFAECKNLESVNLPNCTLIEGNSTFYNASKLKTINISNVITMTDASRMFYYCTALEEFSAPNLTSSTKTLRMFDGCKTLKSISFPKLSGTTISTNTFYGCGALTTLILGGSQLNPLENVNAFDYTPINKGTVYIYVPDALVNEYKQATNWANYADQIKPISELEE